MFKLNIVGGTPQGNKPLCHTCQEAVRIKGMNGEDVIRCRVFSNGSGYYGTVTFPVYECGEYLEKNRMHLYEMEKIAYTIEARRKGPPGFQASATDPGEMEITIKPPVKKADD